MMNELAHGAATETPSIFDRKVLHRVHVKEGPTNNGDAKSKQHIACVVDVETTGFDVDDDGIIQFAARRIRFDDEGVITLIEPPMIWHEDPGKPIPVEISQLTGITDSEVLGERIDEDEVLDLFMDVDIVIAHSAKFDKPFLTKRVPPLGQMLWGCSCSDVDWPKNGFDGRGLGWLCAQAGYFFDGHRALADVDAVVTLLGQEKPDGETILAELVRRAQTPHILVEATGASFGTKDVLRRRGYRWNAAKRVWEREISEIECLGEEIWLSTNVYGPSCGARSIGPFITEMRVADRFM